MSPLYSWKRRPSSAASVARCVGGSRDRRIAGIVGTVGIRSISSQVAAQCGIRSPRAAGVPAVRTSGVIPAACVVEDGHCIKTGMGASMGKSHWQAMTTILDLAGEAGSCNPV
jgi:hypothetical protein